MRADSQLNIRLTPSRFIALPRSADDARPEMVNPCVIARVLPGSDPEVSCLVTLLPKAGDMARVWRPYAAVVADLAAAAKGDR